MTNYLVTTNKDFLPKSPIIMVDGTVPGWEREYYDHHFDHHRPGGGLVQIDEMPQLTEHSFLEQQENINDQDVNAQCYGDNNPYTIVTTLLDADAAVAAAWIQLTNDIPPSRQNKLRAIALDCDYLCIPPSAKELDYLSGFASKAVAALKESTKDLPEKLGLSADRSDWSEEDKVLYASTAYRLSTEWLIAAAKGERPFPGESGEADAYFEQMDKDTEALRQLRAVRLIDGAAFLDMRGINKYTDPRCLVQIAKELGATSPITLTARAFELNLGTKQQPILMPGTKYTLGSLPYHPDAQKLDLTKVFPLLASAETSMREFIGQPAAETTWGGRAAVGGSGHRDSSLLTPELVLEIAHRAIN